MLTFIEILIGIVVIVGVARYIIKGYSATGVLFVGGLILLIVSALLGHKVLPGNTASTGYSATDIIEYIKILLMSRGGDLGMMIMMLCGFATYMTHIGANDMVVKLASKPLRYINSPYLLMIGRLFCRLPDVAGRLLRDRPWRTADGDAVPGNGECRYQPRGRRRHLRLTGGDYPLANLG
ncbi:C4-dicarboxylate transporter DcuC [Klebsiella pneumoniae]|uniref:C4-dicarboxylate transporter DcuC n=1 Tax=Klebsiella pneumoniae TaxID=573 RepID=A0A2X3ELS3_KLEPN|nr:C4-dicarboxylate transporter DcuC [Klebsiella pneumoniae]